MLESNAKALIENKQANIRSLYEKHGGMLLGYIFEIIKDRKLAEEYLVNIFYDLSKGVGEINLDSTHVWCQLQRFAQKKLAHFNTVSPVSNAVSHQNKHAHHLTEDQNYIFYGVYYYGKSIEIISKELNKPEDSIRKTLKEAFAIMRRSCEN